VVQVGRFRPGQIVDVTDVRRRVVAVVWRLQNRDGGGRVQDTDG
jgi:hypothetical protein